MHFLAVLAALYVCYCHFNVWKSVNIVTVGQQMNLILEKKISIKSQQLKLILEKSIDQKPATEINFRKSIDQKPVAQQSSIS